jgi:hypothetical protein
VNPELEARFGEAAPKSKAEVALAVQLGTVLRHGMNEVDRMDSFTRGEPVDGHTVENAYRTHFPMADGREWEITVKRYYPKET